MGTNQIQDTVERATTAGMNAGFKSATSPQPDPSKASGAAALERNKAEAAQRLAAVRKLDGRPT